MSEQQLARRRTGGRLLAHVAVVIGVLAVTAAAFALSYNAVRDIALAAGVTASLARLYPAILDAVFVVACAAALTLRDARWWARGYAWLSVLVTGALIGAAGAYHAMGLRMPHKVAAGTVAALPVALVLLGFSLWLSMLRHTRGGHTAAAPGPHAPAELGAGPALAIETGQPAPAGRSPPLRGRPCPHRPRPSRPRRRTLGPARKAPRLAGKACCPAGKACCPAEKAPGSPEAPRLTRRTSRPEKASRSSGKARGLMKAPHLGGERSARRRRPARTEILARAGKAPRLSGKRPG